MSQAVGKISTDGNVIYREGFGVGFGSKFIPCPNESVLEF